ncbi:hypothetical protein GCM10027456_11490 [Kineosporia babensis]
MGRKAAQWNIVHHRYLWDAGSAGEYLYRAVVDQQVLAAQDRGDFAEAWRSAGFRLKLSDPATQTSLMQRLPVDLEAISRQVQGITVIRPGKGLAIVLVPQEPYASGVDAYVVDSNQAAGLPLLPWAAWHRPFDHELIRLGLAAPSDLHPLVRNLFAGTPQTVSTLVREVRCQGQIHRLRREQGRWIALDHDDEEARAEELLAALIEPGGPMNGCRAAAEEWQRKHAAQERRFAAGPRYRSALAGQISWALPKDASQANVALLPKPSGREHLPRGRRNTKPLIGSYILPFGERRRTQLDGDKW